MLSIAEFFNQNSVQDPTVKDFFTAMRATIPDFNEEDHPTIQEYEAKGGEHSPPGSLTLQEHDILHFLLGRNTSQTMERFLSGFTYGASAECSVEDFLEFVQTMKRVYPEGYEDGSKSITFLYEGFLWGREWLKYNPLGEQSLEDFLEQVFNNEELKLNDVLDRFYGGNTELESKIHEYSTARTSKNNDDEPEYFSPREILALVK